jgi:hypothetical protein
VAVVVPVLVPVLVVVVVAGVVGPLFLLLEQLYLSSLSQVVPLVR